ncbi:MAG: protein-glutamate O-methyltransferase CheR [Lachnospiraceae bacterium]|nr:protein-glutamate O-methyltransferase CheR [Lachnospiraceae bacterium]
MTDDYEFFKQQILMLTGIELNCYKEAQMKRRIDSLILRNKCNSYRDYIALLKANRDKYEQFINYLTINVSEFWRNPEQWKLLEDMVIPELKKKSSVRIWSAACSTGDEPYSLAMLFSRHFKFSAIDIIATDIDKQVLQQAVTGIYDEKSLRALPKNLLEENLTKISDHAYQINSGLKQCISFKQHNLLKDPYPAGCDLIVCRNVLIYFTEDAKNDIYYKFNKALNSDGILFLGSTEQILYAEKCGLKPISSFFYRKIN